MARSLPIPNDFADLNRIAEGIRPKKKKSISDITVDTIRNKSTKNLVIGTVSGWLTGVTIVRVGKIAAFGLGTGVLLLHFASKGGYIHVNWDRVKEAAHRSQQWTDWAVAFLMRNSCFSVGFVAKPRPPSEEPKPAVIPRPEPYKPDEPLEKSLFPAKPIPHTPKITPSSIPNPNPSIAAKEPGYPSYGGFLHNIPGYSAFQPVNYSQHPTPQLPVPMDTSKPDFKPFTITGTRETKEDDKDKPFGRKEFETLEGKESSERKEGTPKPQDFEKQFATKIIPPVSKILDVKNQTTESKMNITSLTQGSGGSVTFTQNKDIKKKTERYSLKTSIPISKIDMKCVSSPVDTAFQNAIKKPDYNPTFQKEVDRPKVEIQSNIIIKAALLKETEPKDKPTTPDRESLRLLKPTPPTSDQSNNIGTLINAAEAINKNDIPFRVPETKTDISKEPKDLSSVNQPGQKTIFNSKEIPPNSQSPLVRPSFDQTGSDANKSKLVTQPSPMARPMFQQVVESKTPTISRPMFNPVNTETNKPNFPNKPPEGGFNEQKTLMFLHNQKQNPRMLLTIQPNPQVMLQRTNVESKNLQAPSRLSSQSKKSEVIADTSSNVVALKRLHQDNCDENDFENLITENQIYGNKIVVKEKTPVAQEEWKNKAKEKQPQQDCKNKIKMDLKVEKTQPETKNVVTQPNIVYLSNVQFPVNVMMIKNNSKICQTTDSNKLKVSPNENKTKEVNTTNNNNIEINSSSKTPKTLAVSNKDIHKLKSSNNVSQTLSNNNNNTDVVFQANQNVIITPQVYQVPIVVTEDNKNVTMKKQKIALQKKDASKQVETMPEKVIITCKVDAKTPKFLIASIRPKLNNKFVEEVSTLDLYEQRKRLRRLKYLSNNKEVPKIEPVLAKKAVNKPKINVITPNKIHAEIYREFSQANGNDEGSSDSDSDCEEDELAEYYDVIDAFGDNHNDNAKVDFLSGLSLATREVLREKQLERHERTLMFDAIASAYIAAGHLESGLKEASPEPQIKTSPEETKLSAQKKKQFLKQISLTQVSPRYKAEYETTWREILRERNRRSVTSNPEPFDPGTQLQILTEINKSVHQNNDLIKRRLDSTGDDNSDIRVLAEKNFSELNRLSKMADRSVKLLSGKDPKKRDLNPGFDSENIKKIRIESKEYPKLIIPSVSKIVSPITDQVTCNISTTQATSMDEPSNSASCGEMRNEVACQAEENLSWTCANDVMNAFIKNYREYEKVRKKEMDDLNRNQTHLRVECAHVTRSASRESDRARALLAERHNLAGEEAALRESLEKLTRAVEFVRSS